MTEVSLNVLKAEKVAQINLLTFYSEKPFDRVIDDFEKQLGKFDKERATIAKSDLNSVLETMVGPSGLMIIGVLDMGQLLPSLAKSGTKARQYQVGNPLIASNLAQENLLAALYAPPRVLIYMQENQTWIAYDQPSTVFGRFPTFEVRAISADLDRKFEALIRQSLA
ncbi:MAG: DUF302 domain-containing protein [Candidatus Melainabacteria bacterium]|nr:DUF302 domain-containing protein [Candidatus Melainabacteria bacterium]